MCCSALITQNPEGIYEAVDFFTAAKAGLLLLRLLFSVCSGSWTDTLCCHRKELISNPGVGETQRLLFLACCRSGSFAMATFCSEKCPNWATGWPQRSHAHRQGTFSCSLVVDPRHAAIICCPSNDGVVLNPVGGAVAAYVLAADLLKSPPIIHSRF